MIDLTKIKLIAFDADDTLWDCQSYFDNVEKQYCEILSQYSLQREEISKALFAVETKNMPILGYGCKAFVLSLIENAVEVTEGRVSGQDIGKIRRLADEILTLPGNPLTGVKETLKVLTERYKDSIPLVVFTKGELLDQENKLERSGLKQYFNDIVVVSDKTEEAYHALCRRFGIKSSELLMVGNSFRSDIAPVLEIGGWGVHILFHITWAHEESETYTHPKLVTVEKFDELVRVIG